MVFTLFGYWVRGGGGPPKGFAHNLPMQFFTLGSSKIEESETYSFDIVTTQNGHPTYVWYVLRQYLCIMQGDSYRRQEAQAGRYDTMRSREYLGAFVLFNINTTHVGNAHSW